jgi:hypothetical protein
MKRAQPLMFTDLTASQKEGLHQIMHTDIPSSVLPRCPLYTHPEGSSIYIRDISTMNAGRSSASADRAFVWILTDTSRPGTCSMTEMGLCQLW